MKVFGLLLLLCGTVAVPGRAARSQSDKYGHNVIDNNWDTEIDHHELETLSCVRLSIFNLQSLRIIFTNLLPFRACFVGSVGSNPEILLIFRVREGVRAFHFLTWKVVIFYISFFYV